jgi:molybdopterin molybdotransferase
MAEFLKLLPPHQALEKFIKLLAPIREHEIIPTSRSLGRVIGKEYYAPQDLPNFRRSTVDGYAVKAKDTYGASDTQPAFLKIIGEIAMGEVAETQLNQGECILIHTGGMLPINADSVVMLEYIQPIHHQELETYRAVAVGENVIQVGEDVKKDEILLSVGDLIRPADLGGLMAFGFTDVEVVKQPLVGIISSGDEIIEPSKELVLGKIRDINAYTIGSLIERAGGRQRQFGIVRDEAKRLFSITQMAIEECDLVIITAGSSASTRDITAEVIDSLGKPGVIVHGVNIKPGKPTILGMCNGKPVIGLPGNPVSALVIAQLFVEPIIYHLLNRKVKPYQPTVTAKLKSNIASQAGREDWVTVRLLQAADGFIAEPILGKSNLIFTLSKADGLICIKADATGLEAGSSVAVHLL